MPVVPCPTPCPPITTGVVQFSAPEFVALYPEFTGLTLAQQTNAFNDAQLLLDNTCGSYVQDANKRLILLYALTAHVCFLDCGTNDGAGNVNPPPGVVGRIDSAGQGSVNVSAVMGDDTSTTEAYFQQTKYGAKFWQQSMGYRLGGHYIPPPDCGPNGPGFPYFPEIE